MKEHYLKSITKIESLHRLFLSVVSAKLDSMGIHDINSAQCLILYNIGREEVTVGELTSKGYYLGSNVTYNLTKLVTNGYSVQEPSVHDRRVSHVKLSQKGLALYAKLDKLFKAQAKELEQEGTDVDKLKELTSLFHDLERFWQGLLLPRIEK